MIDTRDKIMMVILAVAAVCLWAVVASPHETQILRCGGYAHAVKMDEGMVENGMLAEGYDTDGDGLPDIITLSVVTGTDDKNIQHRDYPVFYWVGQEGDGSKDFLPAYVYIDKDGDGACESIVLYADLSKEPRPDIRKGSINE